ncbi:hypothetical protein HNV11_06910 [Spirosoma taeanense]|uniref:Uncharacterized protein n=1 Tax=Spirosoma taeanense TaxID=2735870 RepID=A0A6M5Y725_9BACT|nr:hypothetical protein [Spirosoma taeanense]QJW89140.1 hypothetical protein HNV11_06910 [Spirosoma taeanense]
MRDPVTISKAKPAAKSQDYAGLVEEGITCIQQWASDTWTDHNVHDPGITLLETLSYAITDLGFRGQLPISQLLGKQLPPEKMSLFAPDRALSGNAITAEDFQKLLISLPTVKYARLKPAENRVKGLYNVLVEWEDGTLNDSLVLETITANGKAFAVEFAFPYWDEAVVSVWGAPATLNQVTGAGGAPLQLIPFTEDELNDYFTIVEVRYNTSQTLQLTLVIRLGSQPSPTDRPALEQAIVNRLTQTGPGSAIETFRAQVAMVFQQMNDVRNLLRQNRNLAEDFLQFQSVRIQEIALRATVELAADADARLTLTNMLSAIDLFIDPVVRFSSLAALQMQGMPIEQIYEGPMLSAGFLPKIDEPQQHQLYASDILQQMLQTPEGTRNNAVIAVENFSMSSYVRNRLTTVNAQNSLTLLADEQYQPRLSVTKTDITFFRNGVEVKYDKQQVMQGVLAKRQQAFAASVVPASLPAPAQTVDTLTQADIAQYQSIQYDLPLVYGLKAGTPDSASPLRKAQEKQLRGYLLFFEQILANHLSQLANTATFFSIDADNPNTYFYQPLYNTPQIDQLLRAFNPVTTDPLAEWAAFVQDPTNAYRQRLQAGAETATDRLLRKNKVLEHLLGRFGEELSELSRIEYTLSLQEAQSLEAMERMRLNTARRLLRYKVAFLNDVNASAAGRALGTSGSALTGLSGLERRIFRKTGLMQQQRRKITTPLTDFFEVQNAGAGLQTFRLKDAASTVLLVSAETFATAPERTVFDGIRTVIRFGSEPGYYVIEQTGAAQWRVALTNGNGDAIARRSTPFASPAEANAFINSTATFLYDTYSTEGCYLIEHVLLRPTRPGDNTLKGPDPYSHQLTLVFPSGFERDFANPADSPKPSLPYRYQAKDFRNYVEAVIEQECPAHLIPTVFWLDLNTNSAAANAVSFQAIEAQYLSWLGHFTGGTLATQPGRNARAGLIDLLNTLRQTLA